MKYFLLSCCLLFSIATRCREFSIIKDTADKFAIAVPFGWHYNLQPSQYKFSAWPPVVDSTQPSYQNVSVNIFDIGNYSLSQLVAEMLPAISQRNNAHLTDSGFIVVNDREMFWMDVWYNNPRTNDSMYSTSFVTTDNGKCYMSIANTPAVTAPESLEMFHRMGQHLRVGADVKLERLLLQLPAGKSWKVIADQENEDMKLKQWIPQDENSARYSTALTVMSYKNSRMDSLEQTLTNFRAAGRLQSDKAKFTLIQKEEKPGNTWALFKIESPSILKDKMPESNLYYILQGRSSFHVAFATSRTPLLSETFVKTWTNIFKKGMIGEE
ncbi:hypothetical protein MKQ70_06165 [Chitinophaga sedimenti]|uniref:hypothetical protein n=1 Tax=Chitinophaga sedimenti TaxID=2033606 RepID=UPI002004A1D0|nr:hypothetical protein [Chitinophaga sedimenti]MCK7554610.1 hypothetical protein [Chitinophaga sedimenti]